jgi:hypothetical protein
MTDLEATCEDIRSSIKAVGDVIKQLMFDPIFKQEQQFLDQHNEMKANIILSYRHLEDARMRIGKVMQQIQGGVSKFDRSYRAQEGGQDG